MKRRKKFVVFTQFCLHQVRQVRFFSNPRKLGQIASTLLITGATGQNIHRGTVVSKSFVKLRFILWVKISRYFTKPTLHI